jgi:hypothetical protein
LPDREHRSAGEEEEQVAALQKLFFREQLDSADIFYPDQWRSEGCGREAMDGKSFFYIDIGRDDSLSLE